MYTKDPSQKEATSCLHHRPCPPNAHSLRSRAHIPRFRCTGVCPIAAPDQTSPVKAFLSNISVRKGILLGPCFSHTPRWLRQVLQGASCKVDVCHLWAERGNCSGGRLRRPRCARLCAGHRCGHGWARVGAASLWPSGSLSLGCSGPQGLPSGVQACLAAFLQVTEFLPL